MADNSDIEQVILRQQYQLKRKRKRNGKVENGRKTENKIKINQLKKLKKSKQKNINIIANNILLYDDIEEFDEFKDNVDLENKNQNVADTSKSKYYVYSHDTTYEMINTNGHHENLNDDDDENLDIEISTITIINNINNMKRIVGIESIIHVKCIDEKLREAKIIKILDMKDSSSCYHFKVYTHPFKNPFTNQLISIFNVDINDTEIFI